MSCRRGFTLIEMLIAVVILGVVAGILYGVLHTGLSAYKRGTSEVSASQDVYGFYTLLRDEMSRMLLPEKPDDFQPAQLRLIVPDTDDKVFSEIRYSVKGGTLVRSVKPLKEVKDESGASEDTVVYGVKSFSVVPLEKEKKADEEAGRKLPKAVVIKLEMSETGKTYEEVFTLARRVQAEKK